MLTKEYNDYNEKAIEVLEAAEKIAKKIKATYIGSEHILLALMYVKGSIAYSAFEALEINYKEAFELVKKNTIKTKENGINFSARALKILETSEASAAFMGSEKVGTEHLLLALLQERNGISNLVFSYFKINRRQAQNELEKLVGPIMRVAPMEPSFEDEMPYQTKMVDRFCKDFTLMAYERKFEPVIGRKNELKRIVQILTRKTKNNPLLVGETGVGKTAIVEAFAMNIVAGLVPEQLENKRLLALDLPAMVAGTKYRGEFEERIKRVIEEIVDAGDVILFLDEIHTLIGAGSGEGSLDASNILKPYLARGEIHLIGATTTPEYKKYLSKDKALERRMQKIVVEETTDEETLEILVGLRNTFEKHHGLKITDLALEGAVELSKRYVSDRFLPDKAIDILDEACSNAKLDTTTVPKNIMEIRSSLDELIRQKNELLKNPKLKDLSEIKKEQDKLEKKYDRAYKRWKNANSKKEICVDIVDIENIISVQTGIPVQKLNEKENKKLNNLSKELRKRVIGQDEAISALTKAIKRGRLGISDPKKPLGTFLFLGPTGVGKTELSKALAVSLFGEEKALIRLDMSEYMEKHSVSKMIGSPPGYVGYNEGGGLSEMVLKKPYSVVLFDEIEKAHPDVFNILLQILDDGHITDSTGRKVDFKNTVIIMTGNIGARAIASSNKLGFTATDKKIDYTTMKKNVEAESKKLFRPEFLNRIDEFVVFRPLEKADMVGIVDILFAELKIRLKNKMNIGLSITASAKKHLAESGYDEVYGARPLKRVMVSLLQDRLTDFILEGKFVGGDDIKIGLKDGELSFNKLSDKQKNTSKNKTKTRLNSKEKTKK